MTTFLSLPTEMRFQIFKKLRIFDFQSRYMISPFESYPEIRSSSFRFHTSILWVNKQVSNEALEIFYGSNTFNILARTSTRTLRTMTR